MTLGEVSGGAGRRPDASMTLLNEVIHSPLDPSYAAAAARGQHGARAPRALERSVTFVLACALGLGLVTAITTLRGPTDVRDRARALLVDQVTERRTAQDELIASNAALTLEISELSTSQLSQSDPELLERLAVLGIVSGVTPVEGDAFVVTLADSAQAADDPAAYPEERVVSLDLQIVVNALWAGGAEAIAVNGTRVSGSGAIRGAGSAVLVDLVPVTSPYEVVAIGAVAPMRESLSSSAAAAHLQLLRDRYRISVTTGSRDDVRLPGVRTGTLRFAQPLPVGDAGTAGTGQDGDEQDGAQGPPPGEEGGAQ